MSTATATAVRIRPRGDRVLVTVDQREETTASGLVIPETAKQSPNQGTVVAVGPGKRAEGSGERQPVDLEEGDTVLFSRFGAAEVKSDGGVFLILGEADVLAVIG